MRTDHQDWLSAGTHDFIGILNRWRELQTVLPVPLTPFRPGLTIAPSRPDVPPSRPIYLPVSHDITESSESPDTRESPWLWRLVRCSRLGCEWVRLPISDDPQ